MLWKDQIREWKDEAKEDGLEEGRAEGREEGAKLKALETAKNLLKMNLGTVEQISTATQLPVEEVLKIQKEL